MAEKEQIFLKEKYQTMYADISPTKKYNLCLCPVSVGWTY